MTGKFENIEKEDAVAYPSHYCGIFLRENKENH
jgi:hypothetical protein